MYFYQITFDPAQTTDTDFALFKTAVMLRHSKNAWSHDTVPMWIVATTSNLREFLYGLALVESSSTSRLSALLEKGLVIHQLRDGDVIPQEDAQAWFLRKKQVLQPLAQILSSNPK